MCQKSTAHVQRRSRGESRKLRFGSNLTAPKIWQEGQHDFHSPPQRIDWREHTIGALHDRNLPTRSLQVPESYENFLWHRVMVRSIEVTGLRHDDERDDDRSHRRVSRRGRITSSLDAGWFRLITNVLIQSRDLAMIARWHQCGTMTSQMPHVPVFPPSVWPSSRSNFDLGPSPSDSTEKTLSLSELMILECSFPLSSSSTKTRAPECTRTWLYSCYTAWDSEIESLTSLIKLHQNERRSAPCGQIGAATQPPELATSPTYHFWKSFELHERSKLDELARAVMIGRVLIAVFYHFLISVFPLFHWELCTTLNAHPTLAYSQHQHQATSWLHDDALVRCSHA